MKMAKDHAMHCSFRRGRQRQGGIVMLFALIALVIMLVGSVAMMRGLGISLTNAGNMGFKRELSNQAEQVLNVVLAQVADNGSLGTLATRAAPLKASNYSAKKLGANKQGIPLALLSDTEFEAVGVAGNDIEIADQKVKVRYVIDRLCNQDGLERVLGAANCVQSDASVQPGGGSRKWARAEDSANGQSGAAKLQVVYRISIRVTGPRDTQSFFQTTFAK